MENSHERAAAAAGLDDRPETSIRSLCRWDFLQLRELTAKISEIDEIWSESPGWIEFEQCSDGDSPN